MVTFSFLRNHSDSMTLEGHAEAMTPSGTLIGTFHVEEQLTSTEFNFKGTQVRVS
jgi:hypothetical protein